MAAHQSRKVNDVQHNEGSDYGIPQSRSRPFVAAINESAAQLYQLVQSHEWIEDDELELWSELLRFVPTLLLSCSMKVQCAKLSSRSRTCVPSRAVIWSQDHRCNDEGTLLQQPPAESHAGPKLGRGKTSPTDNGLGR